jgi:iron complex outermembrane recepter protein
VNGVYATPFTYQVDASRTEQDGYRRYSALRSTIANARLALRSLTGGETALHALFYDTPLSQNPGALTRAQFKSDPRLADPPSVRKLASKAVRQHQLGLTSSGHFGEAELTASVYGGKRTLDNPLTFAVVAVDRTSYGASVRATSPARAFGISHRLTIGADVQRQDDDRLNFENCIDITTATAACPVPSARRGNIRLDQRELISSVGPFVRDELDLGDRVRLSVGARADNVRFDVTDHFITATNPDDSGDRTLRAVSPMIGIVVRASPLASVYANVSSSFETPTATEFANKADGSAGINPDLHPQYATTYEAGAKGLLLSRVQYDVAGFLTGVRDELVGFDIPSGNGRRYFRNAGRTRRAGGEASTATTVGPVMLNASYSYSAFRYVTYRLGTTDLAGKRIPGIPMHQGQLSATWRAGLSYLTAEGILAAGTHGDDANTVRAPGYEIANVRAGGALRMGPSWIAPVIGVQNVFDRRYSPSIVVNAAAGKYYEPAAERTVYVGLTLGAARGR